MTNNGLGTAVWFPADRSFPSPPQACWYWGPMTLFPVAIAIFTSGREALCSPLPSVKVRNTLGTSPVHQTSVCLLNFCVILYTLYPVSIIGLLHFLKNIFFFKWRVISVMWDRVVWCGSELWRVSLCTNECQWTVWGSYRTTVQGRDLVARSTGGWRSILPVWTGLTAL